jgi:glycosyltransferase involved in cell wall biosynthesis
MKVLNIMLSKDLGGLQQVFVDYDHMLKMHDMNVLNISSFGAKINATLKPDYRLINLGNWDWISILQLKYIIHTTKPDIIIAHGGRATKFSLYAKNNVPMIGITHSHKLKWIDKSEYIITLTKHMHEVAKNSGIPATKLILLPNAIHISEFDATPAIRNKNPIPIISTMGRFVPKKGMDIFIKSLHILKKNSLKFYAVIGGAGQEEPTLKQLARELKLENDISFIGWVKNKKEFFDQTDIFCLPSSEEPFGIIALEAMLFKKPIVSTTSEGPREILTHKKDALLVPIECPEKMANALTSLLTNPIMATKLGHEAYLTVTSRYDIKIVSSALASHLYRIVSHGT